MAHYPPFLSSLLIIFLCCLAPPTYSQELEEPEAIKEICQNHKNPPFCESFLKDKGGSKVLYLANYAIATGVAKAAEIKGRIDYLGRQTSDNSLLKSYESCSKHYHTATTNLIEAEKALETGDFAQMNTTTINAMASLNECGSAMGPGFDPGLSKKHLDLIYITGVIFGSALVLENKTNKQ